MLVQPTDQPGVDVDMVVLAHEDILMAIAFEDLQLVQARTGGIQKLVAEDVGIGENASSSLTPRR